MAELKHLTVTIHADTREIRGALRKVLCDIKKVRRQLRKLGGKGKK